ncbi:O-antigen ligase family protein [Sphingomonas sanguinis]|uniref:O-antigen ligase family protein n=1 Tax=Sphingomonas sanguinis TaxID=33051 RepID=A0ABU5LPH0_9SPHN|nr:O-antigen ligase family protein [Sphingomonas sanguinis]MDZ7281829.1 O-antigen ligase family protein [Sphingomonas sanguinis]
MLALLPSAGIFWGGLDSFAGQDVVGLAYGLMLALALYALAPSPRFWRATGPVLALMVAALVWLMAVSLGWFGNRPIASDIAPPGLIGLGGLIAALLCGALLGYRRVDLARIADGMLVLGSLSVLWALGFGGGMDMGEGRFLGTLANANASATVFVGLAGLALARALRGGASSQTRASGWEQLRTVAYGIVVLLMLGATLLTGSRNGTVIGALVVGLMVWRGLGGRASLRVVGPMLAVILLLVILLFSGVVFERFQQLPAEASVRLTIWRHSAAIVANSPLTGYGIGSFSLASAHALDDVRQAQTLWMVNSPHNIVLRLLIDGGWPYLLLVTAALLGIAATVVRHARRYGLDIVEWGFVGAVGTAIASSQVDLALEFPAIAAGTMTWIGLLWGRAIGARTA